MRCVYLFHRHNTLQYTSHTHHEAFFIPIPDVIPRDIILLERVYQLGVYQQIFGYIAT